MKRRVSLRIHRDDHKLDVLGRVFLGVLTGDDVLHALRRYLGPTASLHRVELQDDVLEVEVDATAFPEESANMVEIARGHLRAGRERAAMAHLEEALRLAPLDAEVLKALGRIHYRRRERERARGYLVRAREAAPGDLEILRLLAEIAIHDDRRLEARAYLERILRVRPGDRRARVALGRLRPPTEDGPEPGSQAVRARAASAAAGGVSSEVGGLASEASGPDPEDDGVEDADATAPVPGSGRETS